MSSSPLASPHSKEGLLAQDQFVGASSCHPIFIGWSPRSTRTSSDLKDKIPLLRAVMATMERGWCTVGSCPLQKLKGKSKPQDVDCSRWTKGPWAPRRSTSLGYICQEREPNLVQAVHQPIKKRIEFCTSIPFPMKVFAPFYLHMKTFI
ncbi:hypothetical protein GQ55_9G303800 [Panicum hallii var. hallii]|uniref:Uncharacterized protein n=1 Tax=Panicum hallii var. hallii TaxID=1504633 RepID=A0A2T7C7S0_9POAL|nr:hypothetical protein GQ55_9G303800 [Panicum hallii var. hallii]